MKGSLFQVFYFKIPNFRPSYLSSFIFSVFLIFYYYFVKSGVKYMQEKCKRFLKMCSRRRPLALQALLLFTCQYLPERMKLYGKDP